MRTGAAYAASTADQGSQPDKPTWDSTQLLLSSFLDRLHPYLFRKDPDYRSLICEGYVLSRHKIKTIYPTEYFGCMHRDGYVVKGSFFDPLPADDLYNDLPLPENSMDIKLLLDPITAGPFVFLRGRCRAVQRSSAS